MLELNKGVDILTDIGGVKGEAEVDRVLREAMDDTEFAKIEKIKNPLARLKIANTIALGQPDKVIVNTGNDQDKQRIRELCLTQGEERALAIPGHTLHYDLAEEQARIVDRTFYIANPEDTVSSWPTA